MTEQVGAAERVGRAVSAVTGARGVLGARARDVWSRDPASMARPAAFGLRLARTVILIVGGIIRHRIGLHAAALTYYTVFAIVPVLVVMFLILAAFDYLPTGASVSPADLPIAADNPLLQSALVAILRAAGHTSEVTSGLVGLAALLFAVTKMFAYTERALHIISESEERAPRFSRVLGYVALLFLPPAVLAIAGVLVAIVHGDLGARVLQLLGLIPGFDLVLGAGVALGLLWFAATIFYSASARARIAFSSAAVGGAFAAVALPAVLWAFAELEIGVAQTGALPSGLLAGPVFLLWVFSSWFVVLIGCEISVAHRMDRTLAHGARAFQLDCAGEKQAGVAIMVRVVARAAGANAADGEAVTVDVLARDLRLPPRLIRAVAARLLRAGLLAQSRARFTLTCDPDRTRLAAVLEAIERDPALEAARAEGLQLLPRRAREVLAGSGPPGGADPGPTLRELASEPTSALAPPAKT